VEALVVCESVFGNTREVAAAVGRGLASRLPVTVVDVNSAPAVLPAEVDLLVVGGPTHAFGMSRPGTRRDAARQAGRDEDLDAIGLREWLAGLEPARRGVSAAAFDTRIRRPRVPGSAAHRAAARLRHLGFTMLDAPTTFWVGATTGPLLPEEPDRACRWGEQLGARVVPAHGRPTGGTVPSG